MTEIKRIPYGKGDFEAVNARNDYYIDKTMFIPLIEAVPFVFLIRPRRFGKTLFMSTLESYYDINKKDRFEEFYQNTWILKNPTEDRGKYLVLTFNFSEVAKDKEIVQDDFNNYCTVCIEAFIIKYQKYLVSSTIEKVKSLSTAHEKLYQLSRDLRDSPYKIYLMIDEYDNFANSIIADYGSSEYVKLTRNAGYFKQFFSNLKGMASGSGSGLARIFITGVSPVTMDDVTSGFNVGTNISIDEMFNEMLGFTEKDVNDIIDYYTQAGVFLHDKQQTIEIMKKWYDNYRFSAHAETTVFNTDAILYYMLKSYQSKHRVSNLIDDNLRMDYGKLRHLITLDRKLNGSFNKLKQIIDDNGIVSNIKTSFPQDKLTEEENFVSLLYFFGLLTFAGKFIEGRPLLKIPNETIRSMMYEYIRSSFDDVSAFRVSIFSLEEKISAMAYRGDFKPVIKFIADEINKQTSVRDYIQGEKVIQGFFLAYLNISDYYLSLSEEELSKGYADLVLKPFYLRYPDIPYAYLFEFKYIDRTKNKKELQKKIEFKVEESKQQLRNYAADDYSAKMLHTAPYGNVILKKGIIIFHGWELVYLEEEE